MLRELTVTIITIMTKFTHIIVIERIMMDVYYINILIRCGGLGALGAQDDLSLELGGWSEITCTLHVHVTCTLQNFSLQSIYLAGTYQES